MKYIIIFIILAMNCVGFSEENYVALANQLMINYSKELKREKGLDLTGSGGGMMHDIECISLHYSITKSVDINTARKLAVDCIEKLLSLINSNTKIRPYLHNYPFTAANLDFSITFENNSGRFADKAYIAYISLTNGILRYPHYDHETKEFFNHQSEPYQVALSIIHSSTNSQISHKFLNTVPQLPTKQGS